MVRFLFLLGLSVIFLSLGQGCDNQLTQKKKGQPSSSQVKDSTSSKKMETYVWPPVGNEQDVEIASDLTAKNYYVVLDCSGSMAEKGCSKGRPKLEAAKKSLAQFVELVPADANLGLLVFQKDRIKELVPLGKDNRSQFVNAVNSTSSGGGTPLHSAIKEGYRRVEKQGRQQLGYGEYALVIVTDGAANAGQDPTTIVQWILEKSPIQIHTIGFCIGTNHSLNMPGRTIYKAADNPTQLSEGLQEVLAEADNFDVSEFDLN